jgi:hypothetical protein
LLMTDRDALCQDFRAGQAGRKNDLKNSHCFSSAYPKRLPHGCKGRHDQRPSPFHRFSCMGSANDRRASFLLSFE